jgi:hypothetical protein
MMSETKDENVPLKRSGTADIVPSIPADRRLLGWAAALLGAALMAAGGTVFVLASF